MISFAVTMAAETNQRAILPLQWLLKRISVQFCHYNDNFSHYNGKFIRYKSPFEKFS